MAEEKSVPDLYSDLFSSHVNVLGVILVLSKNQPPLGPGDGPRKPEPVAILRFSLENWKAILMTARKQLKAHEAEQGVLPLSKQLRDSLGLTEADW